MFLSIELKISNLDYRCEIKSLFEIDEIDFNQGGNHFKIGWIDFNLSTILGEIHFDLGQIYFHLGREFRWLAVPCNPMEKVQNTGYLWDAITQHSFIAENWFIHHFKGDIRTFLMI